MNSYRNVYYNALTSKMHIWGWNDVGDRIEDVYDYKPYVYIESQSIKDAVSIYNTTLRKVEFKNEFDRRRYAKESGIKRIFYNIPPEQQFLIDTYGNINQTVEFSKHKLKIFFLDIETYSPKDFPNPKDVNDTINLISIYDSLTDIHHAWGLNNFTPKQSNVKYHAYSNETEMLKEFISFWSKDYPDIVTAWNGEGFDYPYLINRIISVLGEDWAKKLSPVGKLYCKENVVKRFGKVESKWSIKGIGLIDYLELYKVFSRDKRESYNLNNIGEIELGEGKTAYNATSLSELADTDWDKFVEYNIQDVNIMRKLEDKLSFLELCRMLAYMGLTQFESALGTISIVTGAVALKAKERGLVIPTFITDHKLSYEGGFVREPERGLKEAVISFDANSLYPNTIITLNISPETKIGKIISKSDKEVEIKLVNGKEYTLPMDKFAEFVEKEKLTISKAKILYTQKIMGICPELIEGIYKERVANKDKIKLLKKHRKGIETRLSHGEDINKINEYKSKIKELTEEINKLNILDYTRKILLNRIYGTFANKYSPFCDIESASSITLTGQACVKEASNILNEYVKIKHDLNVDLTIYQDTDSIYFTILPILNKLKIPMVNDKGTLNHDVYKIADELENELNIKINTWADKQLNSSNARFVFKRESICDAALFIQKKRYILHVLDEEGIEENKTKYVGVEVVSTSTPKKIKPLIKNIVENIFKTKSYEVVNKLYFNTYDTYKDMPLEDIAFPRGIHDIDKYSNRSVGFSTPKSTPMHVKSSIYYNNLLKVHNVEGKYEKIRSGMKIKFFYADRNRYNIESIAFIDKYPDEFDIKINRDLMFKKTITPAIERLYEVLNWKLKDPNAAEVVDLFNLLAP